MMNCIKNIELFKVFLYLHHDAVETFHHLHKIYQNNMLVIKGRDGTFRIFN